MKHVKCRITPLLLSIVEPKEFKNVESLVWGKKNEKNTAENFMKTEGKKHTNPKLLTCGLYLFKPHPYIGASVIVAQNHVSSTNALMQYVMKS